MVRFLPLILLTFGLVLTFSSLARTEAAQPVSDGSFEAAICLEVAKQIATLDKPEGESVVCLKTIKMGLAVLPCPPDPSLAPAAIAPLADAIVLSWSKDDPLKVSGAGHFLDPPPPRA